MRFVSVCEYLSIGRSMVGNVNLNAKAQTQAHILIATLTCALCTMHIRCEKESSCMCTARCTHCANKATPKGFVTSRICTKSQRTMNEQHGWFTATVDTPLQFSGHHIISIRSLQFIRYHYAVLVLIPYAFFCACNFHLHQIQSEYTLALSIRKHLITSREMKFYARMPCISMEK